MISLSKSPLFSHEGFYKGKWTVWCSNAFKNVFNRKPRGKRVSVKALTFPTLQVSPLFLLYRKRNKFLVIKNFTHTKHWRWDFLISLEVSSLNKTLFALQGSQSFHHYLFKQSPLSIPYLNTLVSAHNSHLSNDLFAFPTSPADLSTWSASFLSFTGSRKF